MSIKYLFIDNSDRNKVNIEIQFVKFKSNLAELYDEFAGPLKYEMTENHSFDSKLTYRIQRFLRYEYKNTDVIGLCYDDIRFEELKKLLKDAIPDEFPVGLVLDGRMAYITNESVNKVADISKEAADALISAKAIPVATFSEVMSALENEYWIDMFHS